MFVAICKKFEERRPMSPSAKKTGSPLYSILPTVIVTINSAKKFNLDHFM